MLRKSLLALALLAYVLVGTAPLATANHDHPGMICYHRGPETDPIDFVCVGSDQNGCECCHPLTCKQWCFTVILDPPVPQTYTAAYQCVPFTGSAMQGDIAGTLELPDGA